MYVQSFIMIKTLFFYTSENENPELYKNGGRSAMLQIFPFGGGRSAMKGGRSAMLQIFRGRSAMLQIFWGGEGLQCCRPFGGGGLQGGGLQYNTCNKMCTEYINLPYKHIFKRFDQNTAEFYDNHILETIICIIWS